MVRLMGDFVRGEKGTWRFRDLRNPIVAHFGGSFGFQASDARKNWPGVLAHQTTGPRVERSLRGASPCDGTSWSLLRMSIFDYTTHSCFPVEFDCVPRGH